MRFVMGRSLLRFLILTICSITLSILSSPALAQKPAPTKPTQPDDDVVRVNTELVQTDVTVLDKKGRVVAGLKPEQFELRVDSKPQSLNFFEEVIAGSPAEEKQLEAAREGKSAIVATSATINSEASRGQLIFFFVDD